MARCDSLDPFFSFIRSSGTESEIRTIETSRKLGAQPLATADFLFCQWQSCLRTQLWEELRIRRIAKEKLYENADKDSQPVTEWASGHWPGFPGAEPFLSYMTRIGKTPWDAFNLLVAFCGFDYFMHTNNFEIASNYIEGMFVEISLPRKIKSPRGKMCGTVIALYR